jgi:hypothetical protein
LCITLKESGQSCVIADANLTEERFIRDLCGCKSLDFDGRPGGGFAAGEWNGWKPERGERIHLILTCKSHSR